MAGRFSLGRHQTTLDEDVILEIVARLPLKYAVQCTLLNKNIRRSIISKPNFLPHYSTIFYTNPHEPEVFTRTWPPKIFTSIWQAIRSRTVHPLRRSVTVPTEILIKASCNGLLFLLMFQPQEFFIFNPTTAGIIGVSSDIQWNGSVGLAVPNSGLLKVVALRTGVCLVFRVFEPRGGKVVLKSIIRRELGWIVHEVLEKVPAYADGNLYWLARREEGKITFVFDAEEEKASLIEGPVVDADKWWFGAAEGSVYFVYSLASEIVICRVEGKEWQVARRISKAMKNAEEEPLFYDGRRWLFVWRKSGGGGGDVYRYELVMDVWEKIESLDFKPKFFSYTSTFKEMSTHLRDLRVKDLKGRSSRNGIALLRLQKLLTAADDRPIYVAEDLVEAGY